VFELDNSLHASFFLGKGELYWGKRLVGDVAKGFGDLNCILCLPSGNKMNDILDISRG
jgi:hypothetical protein